MTDDANDAARYRWIKANPTFAGFGRMEVLYLDEFIDQQIEQASSARMLQVNPPA